MGGVCDEHVEEDSGEASRREWGRRWGRRGSETTNGSEIDIFTSCLKVHIV